jgi:uridine kinase
MKKAVLICVTGGTGSGKSTIAKKIVESLPKEVIATILYQDNYYLDNSNLSDEEKALVNYDHPKAFDWVRMKHDLRQALDKKPFTAPNYDFSLHAQTESQNIIMPSDVIIFEGLFSFYDPEISGLADLKIYVDTPTDERLLRRIERDLIERGREISAIAKQ